MKYIIVALNMDTGEHEDIESFDDLTAARDALDDLRDVRKCGDAVAHALREAK
jgi:hypothetical protein